MTESNLNLERNAAIDKFIATLSIDEIQELHQRTKMILGVHEHLRSSLLKEPEHNVLAELHVCFSTKAHGQKFQDAVGQTWGIFNDFTFDPCRFTIPTLDGKEHAVDVVDYSFEVDDELPENYEDDND